MPPVDGANMLGAAADYHNEKPQYGDFMDASDFPMARKAAE
jgi:hypothetical protein